jgi:integral membrane protein (TIGR00529 family)
VVDDCNGRDFGLLDRGRRGGAFTRIGSILLQPENVLMLTVIAVMELFIELLNSSGRMRKTIEALKALLPNRMLLLGGLPALIGLLPMPGGALFSAPMVDSVDHDHTLNKARKASINYWFRHIWEYWWPLYPGVMLAMLYSGLPVWTYILIMIPFTLLSVGAGYLFLLRNIPSARSFFQNEPRHCSC